MRASSLPRGQVQEVFHPPVWAVKGVQVHYSWVSKATGIQHCTGTLVKIDRYGCAAVEHRDADGRTYWTFPHISECNP